MSDKEMLKSGLYEDKVLRLENAWENLKKEILKTTAIFKELKEKLFGPE